MGLLTSGDPLTWYEIVPISDYVKEHGIDQFINIYDRLKDRQDINLKWGDEVEYQIVKFDHQNKRVYLSLRASDILHQLAMNESSDATKNESLWRPEYGEYMLEGTPGTPYRGLLASFDKVESNMRRRRKTVKKLLFPDESIITMPCFPRAGTPNFTHPPFKPDPKGEYSRSIFFPDQAIHRTHPRFKNYARNIRQRRGGKVAINVPIYKDIKTPSPFREDLTSFNDQEATANSKTDHIYMDATGFGMGCCCLQVTFQAKNVNEARWLYDQLTPLTPVLLALSAGSPFFRGYVSDVDSRWNIVSASVDDRTEEELGLKPLKEQKFTVPLGRYDVTDCYLDQRSAEYNDIPLQFEEFHYNKLINNGIDDLLARHIAHLFIRDPLQVFRERIEQDDLESTEHFETIQSSNWRNMRFKPPPIDDPLIGWRVEFRPMEIQLTDFENAAFVCFVALLTRIIISFRLTFLIPISKVNENMTRAQKRDAISKEKFHFRRILLPCDCANEQNELSNENIQPEVEQTCSDYYTEMTIKEIVNGRSPDFPGLIPLIQRYLDMVTVDPKTRSLIQEYLKFIGQRADGTLSTLAGWMRQFVSQHPKYNQDSVISEEICYDLLNTMDKITKGKQQCPSLLGSFQTKPDTKFCSSFCKLEQTCKELTSPFRITSFS